MAARALPQCRVMSSIFGPAVERDVAARRLRARRPVGHGAAQRLHIQIVASAAGPSKPIRLRITSRITVLESVAGSSVIPQPDSAHAPVMPIAAIVQASEWREIGLQLLGARGHGGQFLVAVHRGAAHGPECARSRHATPARARPSSTARAHAPPRAAARAPGRDRRPHRAHPACRTSSSGRQSTLIPTSARSSPSASACARTASIALIGAVS